MRADQSNIEPRSGRDALIAAITRFLANRDAETLDALRESEADVRAGRLKTLAEVRRELGLA